MSLWGDVRNTDKRCDIDRKQTEEMALFYTHTIHAFILKTRQLKILKGMFLANKNNH